MTCISKEIKSHRKWLFQRQTDKKFLSPRYTLCQRGMKYFLSHETLFQNMVSRGEFVFATDPRGKESVLKQILRAENTFRAIMLMDTSIRCLYNTRNGPYESTRWTALWDLKCPESWRKIRQESRCNHQPWSSRPHHGWDVASDRRLRCRVSKACTFMLPYRRWIVRYSDLRTSQFWGVAES